MIDYRFMQRLKKKLVNKSDICGCIDNSDSNTSNKSRIKSELK